MSDQDPTLLEGIEKRAPQVRHIYELEPFEDIKLGEEGFTLQGRVELGSNASSLNCVRLAVISVEDLIVMTNEGVRYGPVDIDGSGQKRTFLKPNILIRATYVDGVQEMKIFEFENKETVLLGRESIAAKELGYSDNDYISRQQADIRLSVGKVVVRDLNSANGTKLEGASDLFGVEKKF